MAAKIINVDELAESIIEEETRQAERLGGRGHAPAVAALIVGDCPAEARLLGEWGLVCRRAGVDFRAHQFKGEVAPEAYAARAKEILSEKKLTGAICRRDLGSAISREQALSVIPREQDVAVETPAGIGLASADPENHPLPPLSAAVLAVLDVADFDLCDRNALIIGNLQNFCLPLSGAFARKRAAVTFSSPNTPLPAGACREADLIIVSGASEGFIPAELVKTGAIILDLGPRPAQGEHGAFQPGAEEKASALLPPGGIDNLEKAMFLHSVLEAARSQEKCQHMVVLNGKEAPPANGKGKNGGGNNPRRGNIA